MRRMRPSRPLWRRHPHAIATAIDAVAARLSAGGRLIYVGAGTSGRLAALDAAECESTFSTSPGQVVALLAGGLRALPQSRKLQRTTMPQARTSCGR